MACLQWHVLDPCTMQLVPVHPQTHPAEAASSETSPETPALSIRQQLAAVPSPPSTISPAQFVAQFQSLSVGQGDATHSCALLLQIRTPGRRCGGLVFFSATEPRAGPLQLIAQHHHWAADVPFAAAVKCIAPDDWIAVEGYAHRTRAGKLSMVARSVTLLPAQPDGHHAVTPAEDADTSDTVDDGSVRIVASFEHNLEKHLRAVLRASGVPRVQVVGGRVAFRWPQQLMKVTCRAAAC